MKSNPVISANALQRLASADSPFHPDYLAFRGGELTRTQLLERLPHVVLLGDSVCTGIHITSVPATFWRARRARGGNWFLHRRAGEINSVLKRLEAVTPIVATEYAGVGAMIDEKGERLNFFRKILGTQNFSGQVTQLLTAARFPDLVLISLGHNNADWTWWSAPHELQHPDGLLQRQSRVVRQNFSRELRKLLKHARRQAHRVAIVIYGLINFGAYFEARAKAERLRLGNRRLYPHLETTYKYFNSMRPPYRRDVARFARMINSQLREMVQEFNSGLSGANVTLQYSDALARADLSRLEVIHQVDGWHPSVEGHNVLAEAAFAALGKSLEFLGLATSPNETTKGQV